MNFRLLAKLLGTVAILIGAAMIFSLPWAHPALGYRNAQTKAPEFEWAGFWALFASMLFAFAVGFLLLRLFAVDGLLGRQTLGIDLHMLLNWRAAVLAAAVMSFPLVVRTAKKIDKALSEDSIVARSILARSARR